MAAAAEYLFVDTIPEVALARQEKRNYAETLLENRRSIPAGQFHEFELPLQVDALSTAHKVLNAAAFYGEGSEEHAELYEGLVLDCQRLVGEWYRKKKPEYFPPLAHTYDDKTESFYSHGLSLSQMTENGIVPMPDDPEDEARRVNEHVEDDTARILRSLGCIALGDQAIRTISECTDKAVTDYAEDMRLRRKPNGYKGYVPDIEKVMIRDIRLDEKSTNRYQEQIGLPGTYITHFVIQKALESKGADASLMDKTALHGSQLMVNDDLLEFAKLLDTVASDEWCVPIFMGEVVEREHPRDYANFRHDALQRQTLLKEQAETTALYILDLAAEDYDRTKAPAKVEAFVKSLLLDVAKEDVKQQLHETGTADTTIVEQMFDARTAQDLQTVIALEAQGMARQAFELMQQVEERAPGGGYCGAGSCGLSAVDTSGEEGKGIADRLGAKAGDKVVKDSERSCKCGSKEIYYAYNSREVRKLCESCGKTEYKESPSSST